MPNDTNQIDRLIEGAFEHDRSSMPAQSESPDARLLEQLARASAPSSQTSSAGRTLTTGAASPVLTKVFLTLFGVAVVGSAVYLLTRSSDEPIAPPAPVRVAMPIDSPVAPRRVDTTSALSAQQPKATPLPVTKRTDTTLTSPLSTDDNLLPPATRKRYRSDSANVPIHQAQRRLPK